MNISIFGKAIIAGEHAVIRGSPALVVPVKSKSLTLEYRNIDQEFKGQFLGEMSQDLSLVFWGVLERALNIMERKHSELKGELILSNTVPVGAGLGASATLCVAMGRFFEHLKWVHADNLYEFCRQLENLFHGESSGVDIASTLSGTPIQFQRPNQIEKINFQWKPKLYLSYCGQRGITSECVRKVKALWDKDEALGKSIDNDMRSAVELAIRSFQSKADEGLPLLVDSMTTARNCFEQWGLIEGPLEQHMDLLTAQGALAVKPTGSGRGGYVLSLWQTEPPKDLNCEFLELFL